MIEILLKTLYLLKGREKTVISLILANLVYVILVLIEPMFYKNVIDTMIGFEKLGREASGFASLQGTLMFWLFVGLNVILLRLFVSIFADRMAHEEFNKVITKYFTHTLSLSMGFHTSTSSGKMSKELIRGSDNIFYTHLELFRQVMPRVFTIILLIPLIIYLNVKLGLVVIVF